MRLRMLSLVLGMLLSFSAVSGAEADDTGFYLGGGGLVGTLRLQLDDFNQKLGLAGFTEMDSNILFMGGGGAIGSLYWNIGGWGFSGEAVSTSGNSEAVLTVNAGGFNVERALPLGPLAFKGGVMIGGGEAELVITTKAHPSIDEALKNRYETRFNNAFFALIPSAGFRLQLAELFFLEADGGYLFTVGDWKFQNNSIVGLPRIGGPVIKVGVVFGAQGRADEFTEKRDPKGKAI